MAGRRNKAIVIACVMLAGCNLLSGAGDLVTSDAGDIDDPERRPPTTGGEAGTPDASDDAAVPAPESGSTADAGAEAGDAGPIRPDGGRFVFVSSTSTNGNLSGFGGADSRCNTLALKAGLGGNWVAWLSIDAASGDDAVDRITNGGAWYLVEGTRVAASKSALLQDALDHSIDRDESGALVTGQRVWTGTRNGIAYFGDCDGWKTTTANEPGTVGNTSSKGTQWTADLPAGCNVTARVYCFEK